MCSLRGHNGDGDGGDGDRKSSRRLAPSFDIAFRTFVWRFGGFGVASTLLHV